MKTSSLDDVTAAVKMAQAFAAVGCAEIVHGDGYPDTALIHENGVIQWIDQADDYRIRSNGDRVLQAVKSAFS